MCQKAIFWPKSQNDEDTFNIVNLDFDAQIQISEISSKFQLDKKWSFDTLCENDRFLVSSKSLIVSKIG